MANGTESPRVVLSALVSKAAKDYLAQAGTGQFLKLQGVVSDVNLIRLKDGSVGVAVMLEQCDQPGAQEKK